ncbi:hypothetical protein ACO3UB_08485 (plasmid) [Methanocaldococcus sp. 16A]
MGLLDWLNDLSAARQSDNISSSNYTNSATELMYPSSITVSVYEGEGTGIDGGGGVNYYTDGYSTNLQNGTYTLPINEVATFSSGYTDASLFDNWEDKWVDVYYGGVQIAHVHIGNNTPDAVMSYTIQINDLIKYIANNQDNIPNLPIPDNIPYPDYSEQNYYYGQGTYNPWGAFDLYDVTYDEQGNEMYIGHYYDTYYTPDWVRETWREDYYYYKEFENDGLPIGGNWALWGDYAYNWISSGLKSVGVPNTAAEVIGGTASVIVGGLPSLIYGTGWALGKAAATKDIGYLTWWGEQLIGGTVQMATTPVRALAGENVTPREWGEFTGLIIGPKLGKAGWKSVAKIGDWYRTRTLPKLPATEYIHPEAMDASKPIFPAAKSFDELKKSFEQANNKVITFTPDKIVGNVVGDSRKGALGLEDSGIYVAPKGYGNPYFTRKADYTGNLFEELNKGIEFKWNLIENLKEKWNKYGTTGRVYETQVKGVVKPPDDVLNKPGFSAVNEWGQKNLVGTGYIRFTKRSLIGQGVVKPQKYWNPEMKKWSIEKGTKEFEAIIDKGYRFVDEGPVGYIEWGGRRIIVNKVSLVDNLGRKIGEGFIDEKGNFLKTSGKIMDYKEFANKIKEYTKPYYEEKYSINLDTSLHYVKPNTNINYNSYKINNDANYIINYKPDMTYNPNITPYFNSDIKYYPDYTNYNKNYNTQPNYKPDYKPDTNIKPNPNYNTNYNINSYPDINPNPNITPDFKPDVYPNVSSNPNVNITPNISYPISYTISTLVLLPYIPGNIPEKYRFYKTGEGKGKGRKRDYKNYAKVFPKNFPQGAAKTKRDWYVNDLEKMFKDVENILKKYW